jgi:hypothetical protein
MDKDTVYFGPIITFEYKIVNYFKKVQYRGSAFIVIISSLQVVDYDGWELHVNKFVHIQMLSNHIPKKSECYRLKLVILVLIRYNGFDMSYYVEDLLFLNAIVKAHQFE